MDHHDVGKADKDIQCNNVIQNRGDMSAHVSYNKGIWWIWLVLIAVVRHDKFEKPLFNTHHLGSTLETYLD